MSVTQETNGNDESSTEPPQEETEGGLGRRTFLKGVGTAAGAGTVYGGAELTGNSPIGEARAVPPLVVGGAIATTWLIANHQAEEATGPNSSFAEEEFKTDIYQIARTRKSTNASTFVDNRNLLQNVDQAAYVDGKLSAIEQLNNQESQDVVTTKAVEAAHKYLTTVQKNLLKSWNESVRELKNILNEVSNYDNITVEDITNLDGNINSDRNNGDTVFNSVKYPENEVELIDGSTMTVISVEIYTGLTMRWSPVEKYSDESEWNIPTYEFNFETPEGNVSYLAHDDWNPLITTLEDKSTELQNGLTKWVDGIYNDVQSGSIEVSDLLTPRERAEQMSDREGYPQAIADLQALNVPVDVEREAEIKIPSKNATMVGTFGVSDSSTTLKAGNTYDPNTDISGDVYFTYDLSKGSGVWEAYQEGVDGGVATFTSAPYEQTEYEIKTSAGETATVTRSDFVGRDSNDAEVDVDSDSATSWEVDLSSQLENQITNISSVSYDAGTSETQFETIRLTEPFEIVSYTNTETGEEASEATFTRNEPQNDTNYITQEEWDELQQQNKEIVEKYENDDLLGGAGGGVGGFSWRNMGFGALGISGLVFLAQLLTMSKNNN